MGDACLFAALGNESFLITHESAFLNEAFNLFFSIESLPTYTANFFNFIINIYFLFCLIGFYLSYFHGDSKNAKLLDSEALSVQSTVLSEEELGSYDDKFFYMVLTFLFTA
jgi:hypothetical protein